MKLKSILLVLSALVSISLTTFAQPQGKQSYNFTRALEEVEKGNNADALEYLQKEIGDNPNNGYAHMTIAILQADAEQYKDAMSSINLAIKELPKKDKEYTGRAYASRAHLYAIAGDTVSALADFTQAIRINPDDEDVQEAYGQMLYELKRYDEADAAYHRIVSINPTSVMGYMGLGRDAYAKGNYEEAIKQYDTVIKMYEDYSSGYAFRAESYLKLGKYLEAINDITKSLSIDNDAKARHYLFEFPDDQTTLVVTKLKGMAVKNPHNFEWWYYIGQLFKDKKMYAGAIEALQKAFDIDAYPGLLEMISECYQEMGDYAKALASIDRCIQMDPDNDDLIATRANILGESGDIEGAITEWTKYIDKTPDFCGGYYRRGFIEDNSGQTDKALEDYEMAIILMPEYAHAYLGKGDMLERLGRHDEALAAYQKIIEIDTIPDNESCAMYALLALNRKDEAVEFLDRVLASENVEPGNYYDAACFYCRLGEEAKALNYLRIAFEKGFRRFSHVRLDDDLAELRSMPEFDELIKEYEQKVTSRTISPDDETDRSKGTPECVEVPFTPSGGVNEVSCTINDLPLKFIFDTGASIVSISMVEANFMMKNGYLKRSDVVGTGNFYDANGDISEGTIINLRKIDFGGLQLNNVRASVVKNQKAPLLLGQSVLGRLGKIEIDNQNRKLIIKTN